MVGFGKGWELSLGWGWDGFCIILLCTGHIPSASRSLAAYPALGMWVDASSTLLFCVLFILLYPYLVDDIYPQYAFVMLVEL
jgi:hypothetical protein